jgi:hypothetical protein
VSVVKAGTARWSTLQSLLVAFGEQVRQTLVEGDSVIALGLVGLVLLVVQNATPNVIGIDGYYHIKFAWLMRQDGFHPRMDFPWLPLTVLNPQDFTDHHLLYHLTLIPFTFGDLRLGAKASALVFASLAILATYLLMTRLKVRYPLGWLLALLGSAEWFLGRLSMTRRQSLSLLLLMLATYLLIQGRYRWMLAVAFAYAWLFDGFVLLIAVVGLAFGARLIADRRWAWPMLGWTGLGLALALLLNPYYPNNITFTILHVLPKLAPPADIQVGGEWAPYSPDVLFRTSWLAIAFVLAGLVPLLMQPRRALRDRTVLFLLGLALFFLLLYTRSRRWVEIEPAFAVLLCSYTWVHYGIPRVLLAEMNGLRRLLRAVLALVTVVLLGWQLQQTVWRAQRNASGGHPWTGFQEPTQLVIQSSDPGDRIFQTDWDDFPELFFHDSYNTYIIGLDPTYMFLENPELYRLWRSIGRGQVAMPAALIRDRFGARWVLTDRAHDAFIEQAARDPNLEIVYESRDAVLYRVAGG